MSDSWHWKTKDCLPWTREWLSKEVVGLKSGDEKPGKVSIDSVQNIEGDIDLCQRKGQLKTIYDFSLELGWKGQDAEGQEVDGTITIPEVAHEVTEKEMQFEIRCHSGGKKSESLVKLLRQEIQPIVLQKLAGFSQILIDNHGTEFLEKSAGPPRSSSTTPTIPVHHPKTTSAAASAAPPAASIAPQHNVNTTSITKNVELAAPAFELWSLLFDPNRIPTWSRSPAKIDVKTPGSIFELFNGSISGTMVEAREYDIVQQRWRIQNWPEGHYGTMVTRLIQGSNTTEVQMKLDGVPVGEEETTEDNIEHYIFRPLKMMGLGTIL